jgi:hypothetical protein
MSRDDPVGDRERTVVKALALGAAAAFGGSAALHTISPKRMAGWAAWVRSDHYQREIAVFDAVHALGLIRLARRPDDANYLQLVSLTGLLLGLNHHYARRRGDAGPVLNPLAAWGNTAAATAGLMLAMRVRRRSARSARRLDPVTP